MLLKYSIINASSYLSAFKFIYEFSRKNIFSRSTAMVGTEIVIQIRNTHVILDILHKYAQYLYITTWYTCTLLFCIYNIYLLRDQLEGRFHNLCPQLPMAGHLSLSLVNPCSNVCLEKKQFVVHFLHVYKWGYIILTIFMAIKFFVDIFKCSTWIIFNLQLYLWRASPMAEDYYM